MARTGPKRGPRGATPQKVMIVKPKRKKTRGPKITKLLKDKTVAKLRYVDSITLDPGAGGLVSHSFGSNDCYDPDVTGVGHQPLMWDEYVALYHQYRVLSSTIKVTPLAISTSNVIPALYGVFQDTDGSIGYSTALDLIEDMRVGKNYGVASGFGSTGYTHVLLQSRKSKFLPLKQMGPEQAIDSYAVTGSPPADTLSYYHIWAGAPDGTTNPGSNTFLVELEYVVEFTQPKTVTPS